MAKGSGKGKVALGAVVGAAAGLVVGILTAPKSGKETRADIKAKAGDVKAKASAKVSNTKARAKDLKVRSERAVDAAKKSFNSKK